jgi:hypothetical protein
LNPAEAAQRFYHSFHYQAKSWDHPRRVVANVEWHQGELFPRVGFIVTNLGGGAKSVVDFYNQDRREDGHHARYVTFQLAEVAVPRRLYRTILERITSSPTRADWASMSRGAVMLERHGSAVEPGAGQMGSVGLGRV